uniref:Uncharacterized protein n=1 Tax=Fagus sylvatica TaxID=28930 RepID=A0A2N9EWS0_FAGSY
MQAEWYSQLKKISHWKELADTFLAQYGFNSQIAPDRFDLQRMEKKSNETFREYAQRWREKAARARPPLDEREMIKIFVDTLKNPYFDRMMGLQMQFFVDLIPVGDRIEDALKTKKIVDMTALMALAEQAAKKAPTKRKEGDVQMIGRNNGRPRQVLPTFTMQPIQPRPIQAPAPTQAPAPAPAPQMPARPEGNQPNDNRWLQKRAKAIHAFTYAYDRVIPHPDREEPNLTYLGHTVENCGQLRHRVQDLIDHGVLKFEGLPNITTNPLPKHPEGGVNMVEDAPPGPSTGDSCEYHSGARGHSLDCCEEFKKKVTNLMENGIVGREEIPSKGSRQPDDPSEFDWYAEINLDDIVEDEMDLDNLQDEEADWGYFMEDDTDEWRDVDLTEFFQFPYLIMPPGFVTPEFEIFYEDGDPEVHLQKYGEKMALHLENELLMISVFPESLSKQTAAWFYQLRNLTGWDDLVRVFLERYRFNPHSILEYLGLKKDEEPYIIPDPGKKKKEVKAPPLNLITTATVTEEEDAGPMVEGLSIHTITEEEDSTTTPPTRHCQQGEGSPRRGLAYHCYSVSRRLHAKPQTIPTSPKIDNKTDCSLDNIDNSDEEIELPNDILEALERQDEGSKPNIEELEIVNLANEGEEPREVKIGTRCAAEQKEALIALLREFHEIFAWSYQDMPGLDTDIVVHKIPLKPECKPVKQALRRMKPEVILKIKEGGGKAVEGRFPKHSNLFGLGSQYSPGAEEGRKTTNVVFSFMDGFSGYNQIKMAEEDKSKTAFVTHWGTFVYDVMPFGLKNAGATYQRAMVTLFHDMIHHEIEVYVDDMIAKSRNRTRSSHRPAQIVPTTEEVSAPIEPEQMCLRRHIRKVIRASSSAAGELRLILQRKDVKIKWTEDCQKAFDKIKEYLLNPPILVPPTPGRPLILYLTVQEASMGCMLGQQDETGKKEQAIYYLSKKFTEPETRYLLVEKTCCALAWASKKLRQYMLYYTTWLAIKGQAIADYLADYPSEQLELMDSEFPDEDVMIVEEDNQGRWKLYFDGAANAVGSGIGAVLHASSVCKQALEFGAYELEVFGDSLLIVSQTNGEWQARDPKLIPYQRYISRLIPKFKYVTFTYTPRAHNHFADALATLASLIKLVEGDDVRPLRIETRDIPAYCVCIEECMNVEAEIDDKPWYYDIKRFIQDREHVQTCHKCQMYQNSKNAPPQYLHTMASPWPFSAWGMDVIGAITPKASNGHEFILVAIDYFTKWVEACSFKNVTQVAVTRFVKNNIICRYASSSRSSTTTLLHTVPKMNGAVEAANKNVKKILSKMTETYKDWHEHLPYALCAYRTSVRTSVGATPYSLVYGMEAVLPVEVEIPSLRILSQTQLEEAEWAQARAYNKKARPRTFQPGDLVLKKRNMALSDPRGKFAPSYEGPYVVKKAFSGGAIILADMDGEEFRFTH